MSQEIEALFKNMKLTRSRNRWRWLALLGLAAVVIYGLGSLGGRVERGPHIARLNVSGVIVGSTATLNLIRDLRDDKDVKALVVRIDSPGGTTVGSEALYDALREFGASKPLVAVMDSVAASGGYITALAADRVYARGNTITGSIGVIFQYPDVSQLLGTVGVKMETVKSAELKGEPSGYAPTPPKARAVMQQMVDDGFGWFKGLVRERRKLDEATVDRLADGRVYSGRQALAEKLIDALGTEDDAKAWLVKEKAIDEKLKLVTRAPASLRPSFNFSFADSAKDIVAEVTGLSAFRAEGERLDGLLVLWRPEM